MLCRKQLRFKSSFVARKVPILFGVTGFAGQEMGKRRGGEKAFPRAVELLVTVISNECPGNL